MRTSTLTVALVSALLVAGAGAGGAFAATTSLQPQASPTGTTTTGGSVGTTTAGSGAGTTTSSGAGTTAGSGTGTTTVSGPAITFDDQNSSGETVLIQSATLPQDGFIAIYDSTRSGNRTDKVIGASYLLNAGTSDNIRIQLNQPLNQTTSLTAVYHVDSNNNGQFDYVSSNGQQDPAPPAGNQRTVDIAQVTVQSSDTGGATGSGGASTTTGGATAASAGTQTAASGGGAGTAGANGSGGNASGGGGGGSGAFGPGFGLAIAVVALLAVALLAGRRN